MVILTKAGEIFIENAKQAVSSFEKLKEDMDRFRYASKDHIRIGLMRSVQYRYMLLDISHIQEAHPGIALSLCYEDSADLRQMLIAGELDGAFLLPGDADGIGDFARWELPYRIYALVPQENPLSRRTVLGLRDLDGQRLVLPGSDEKAFAMLVHLLSHADIRVELSLPRTGEPLMDARSIAFIPEGGHVPEALRSCEILPMRLVDLYGLCFVVRGHLRENELISALIEHFA